MLRMAKPSLSKGVGAISWVLWDKAWYKAFRQAAHSAFGLFDKVSTYPARHMSLHVDRDSSQSARLTIPLGV